MTEHLSGASRVVASRDQVSTTVAGETVILGMADGVYFGLDAIGTRVWALIQEPALLDQVAATIVAEYDVTGERALADVLALVDDLRTRGLAEVVPVPADS